MKSLSLVEAAEFLGIHPVTLQARAKAGEIRGAKIGRAWRFMEPDLLEYFQSKINQPRQEAQECRSTYVAKRGGTSSTTKASAFEAALALPTKRQPNASTTKSAQNSGPRLVFITEKPGSTPARPG
jgi:excisionase family DNA binding protein